MNAIAKRHIILCNGAPKSAIRKKIGDAAPVILDYRDENRMLLQLPNFIRSVGTVPQRVLDLLEICAYVFAADRLTSRGEADSVVFDSWSRTFNFAVKVRDFNFWDDPVTKKKLSKLLEFISGDRQFGFEFVAGHETPPTHLFDREDCLLEPNKPHHVMLFSGGLDSLAGAVECLNATDDAVCLISHRSGQPSTAMTQDNLVAALSQQYPGRVKHYKFSTSLTNGRAVSETQRTRTFIYGSISFALASALKQDHITFYENGITSFNFPRRQDLLNSRASRTTHPKTMFLLGEFLSHVAGREITVANAYRWKTKADVLDIIKSFNAQHLIPSAVTCSRTPMSRGEHTHCGGCFQCIDRRFSASAIDLTDIDHSGLYTFDFLSESISDPQIKTAIIDYVRLGIEFNDSSIDSFYNGWLAEIAEATCAGDDEATYIPQLYSLVKKFGQQTVLALKNFNQRDDVTREPIPNTLLQIIHHREYLKDEPERFALSLSSKLRRAIPTMFLKNRPKDENDFNDKLNGLIQNDNEDYRREFPVTSFGLAKVIPDHEIMKCNLIIESKYLRSNTTASKITDPIAADLVKYPEAAYIVFVIYDPDRSIKDDHVFIRDIEAKRKSCMVSIIR